MKEFILRRVIQGALVIFAAMTVSFLIMYVIGDPVVALIGAEADAESIEAMRKIYGLDKPVYEQYFRFIANVLRGDLGTSMRYRQPVLDLILSRFWATMKLTIPAFILAAVVSVFLGTVSAVRRNTAADYGARIFALIGQSAPTFWVGIMLMIIFAVRLKLLPASGYGGISYMILPVITLSLLPMAYLTRIMRGSILDILEEDYIRTARSKGLSNSKVLYKHVLRNALIPFITVGSMQFIAMLAGSMMVETIFSWPGLGRLLLNSIRQIDIPLIAGAIMFKAFIAVFFTMTADILYAVVDPRIRAQ